MIVEHPILKIEEYKGFKLQTLSNASCDHCVVLNHPVLKCSDTPCNAAEREDGNNVSFIEALPTEQHKEGVMQPILRGTFCDCCFYDDKFCGDIACSSEGREDNNDVFFIKLEDAKPEEPIITANNKAKGFGDVITTTTLINNNTLAEESFIARLGTNGPNSANDCKNCYLNGTCDSYEIDNYLPCFFDTERLNVEGVYYTKD